MEAVGPSAAVHEPPATARARTRHQAPIRAPPALRRAGREGGGGGGGGGGQAGCRQINAARQKKAGPGAQGGGYKGAKSKQIMEVCFLRILKKHSKMH